MMDSNGETLGVATLANMWVSTRNDWASHPMGPVENWPEVLQLVLATIQRVEQPMLIAWGPERYIFYNDAYAPILAGRPDAIGQPLDEVFAESWDLVEPLFARAQAGTSVNLTDFEAPLRRNGRTEASWWTVSFSPIPVGSGGVGGVLCIVHETTRTRLAEARTREAQEELGRITDLVPSLLWRADSFGRTVWQNGRLRALSAANGADASNVWRKLVHPDDLPDVLNELNKAKLDKRPFAKTFRLKISPTEFHWYQARSEPALDDKGGVTGWFGVATDIQDVRNITEALEDREAIFSQFASNSASLLWIVDLDTLEVQRLSANFDAVWPNLTSSTRWTWSDFVASVHDADRPAVEAGFTRARQGDVVQGRFRIQLPGQTIRMFDGTTFPIFNNHGAIPCLGGILRDLTPEVRPTAHLVDSDPASQNKLSHSLRKLGLDVKTFDSVTRLASVADALKPGPILYRYRGQAEDLRELSGLIKSGLTARPWLVIQDCGPTAREAVEIMKLGASDVLEANSPVETIASALFTAATSVRGAAIGDAAARPEVYRLTAREQQILKGIVGGGTNKSIALTLGLSPRTVETHRSHIMERLGVTTLAEMVTLATRPSFRCITV